MASILVSATSSNRSRGFYPDRAPRWFLVAVLLVLFPVTTVHAKGIYQTGDAFLQEVFAGDVPEPSLLWLAGDLKGKIDSILSHPYSRLRVRYWKNGAKTAWILQEIGKERPITLGFVVSEGHIARSKVLAFRESRGWEIRHPSFTRQFDGVALGSGKGLDRSIDGITGATLSVRAYIRLAEMALTLDHNVQKAE